MTNFHLHHYKDPCAIMRECPHQLTFEAKHGLSVSDQHPLTSTEGNPGQVYIAFHRSRCTGTWIFKANPVNRVPNHLGPYSSLRGLDQFPAPMLDGSQLLLAPAPPRTSGCLHSLHRHKHYRRCPLPGWQGPRAPGSGLQTPPMGSSTRKGERRRRGHPYHRGHHGEQADHLH